MISPESYYLQLNKIIQIQQIKSPLKLNRIDFWLCRLVSTLLQVAWMGNRHWIKPEKTAGNISWMGNQIADDCWLLFNTIAKGDANYKRVYYDVYCYSLCVARVKANRCGVNLIELRVSVTLCHRCAPIWAHTLFNLHRCRTYHPRIQPRVVKDENPTCFSFEEHEIRYDTSICKTNLHKLYRRQSVTCNCFVIICIVRAFYVFDAVSGYVYVSARRLQCRWLMQNFVCARDGPNDFEAFPNTFVPQFENIENFTWKLSTDWKSESLTINERIEDDCICG